MQVRVSENEDERKCPADSSAEHSYAPKHIMQLPKQCGQTCVAIITHLPVDFIVKEFNRKSGTTKFDVYKMLSLLGWDCAINVTPLRDYRMLPQLSLMDLRVKGRSYGGHWAVCFEGMVYDPGAPIIMPLEDYFKIYDRLILRGFLKVEMHPSFIKK